MNKIFHLLYVYFFLICSSIILNASGQDNFVFSDEEERIKTELINVFVQAGSDRVKLAEAVEKFDRARVEALEKKQYAFLDWLFFDSMKIIACIRSEYIAGALEVSLNYLYHTGQREIALFLHKKRKECLASDVLFQDVLFPRDEDIDVCDFLVKNGVILDLNLKMLKGMGCFSLDSTLMFADLLTLKHLTFSAAYAEGMIFQNLPGFNKSEFVRQLTLNFGLPIFKRLNDHFSSKVWSGHVTYSDENVKHSSDSETDIFYGECLLQQDRCFGDLIKVSGPVESADDSKITYAFRKPKNAKMSSIVVDVYSGYTKDIAVVPSITDSLSDSSIGIIALSLPDCVSDVYQGDQVRSENFSTTHARYLRIVSDFIERIRSGHPNIPIFLKGGSFGGFFVSSYALLQSVGVNTDLFNLVYPDFVKDGFSKKFERDKLSNVDGIISCFGGTYYMDSIVSMSGWSQFLTIPAFYYYNFDDDRIDFYVSVNALLPSQGAEYNPYISLNVKRRAVKGFLIGFNTLDISEKEAINQVFKDFRSSHTSVLGHSGHGAKDFDEQIVHFIHSSQAITPLRKVRQKRLFEMYKNERLRLFKLSDFSAKDLCCDLIQFLQNIREIEKKLSQGIRFTEEELLNQAMYLVFENLGDIFSEFVLTHFADDIDRFNAIGKRYGQEIENYKSKDAMLESVKREGQEIANRMQVDFESEFPSWAELYEPFYKEKMKSYYDNLKKYAEANYLWGKDISEEGLKRRLSFLKAKEEDLQQFLSNLRNTQKRIENEGPIRGVALIESHMRLVNGNIDQVCVDFGKSLSDADKDAFNVFVEKQKKESEEKYSDIMPQSLQNQALIDELVLFSGFTEFYLRAQKEYHDELMKSVSTRGLWKEAFNAVRAKMRVKRTIESLALVKETISASLA